MIRSSKFSLKFITKKKRSLLDNMFLLYKTYLQKTIDLLWEQKFLDKFMSSKDIYWMDNLGGQYKQLIYKQAIEIIKSVKNKKVVQTKPIVNNITINLDERMVEIQYTKKSSYFDRWIEIHLPFIQEGYKNKRIKILIPIREHKHSLRFKDWNLHKTVQLSKNNIILIFEKEDPEVKEKGEVLGVDLGYKNLITTSERQFLGKQFDQTYTKIIRKTQGSNAFKRSLTERDNKINEIINKELDLTNINLLKTENLKNLKQNIKGRFSKKFNNKYQRFVYRKVLTKLERKCQEEAVQFLKVSPAYTSQTCPLCLFRHKNNRNLEKFKCLNCSYEDHSDIVGAINISRQEPIVSVVSGGNKCL